MPSGKDLESGDYALLREELIATPEQLTRILARNDNITFALAGERYAKGRGWTGFEVITDESEAREYGDKVFDICQRGASIPGGYFSMYAMDENFIPNVGRAYGLEISMPESGESAGESDSSNTESAAD